MSWKPFRNLKKKFIRQAWGRRQNEETFLSKKFDNYFKFPNKQTTKKKRKNFTKPADESARGSSSSKCWITRRHRRVAAAIVARLNQKNFKIREKSFKLRKIIIKVNLLLEWRLEELGVHGWKISRWVRVFWRRTDSYQQNCSVSRDFLISKLFYYILQIYVLFYGPVGHPPAFYFAIASHMSLSMFLLPFFICQKITDNSRKQVSVFVARKWRKCVLNAER